VPTQDNFRTRLFQASARAMSILNFSKDSTGLLAREVLYKRCARPPYSAGTEEIGLEYPSSPWLKSAIDAAQDWIQSV
jgi:hypothetical protein